MRAAACVTVAARGDESVIRRGNLRAAADHQQRDNVLHRNAFDEAKSGRCDIDRPLGVIKKRTGFIRAARSTRSRQLRGVFSVANSWRIHAQSCSELVCLPGCSRDAIGWGKGNAFAAGISSRDSPGFEVESQGYLTGMGYDGSSCNFGISASGESGCSPCRRDLRQRES